MKKLMMLVLICASIFTYNQSYASVIRDLPSNKSAKSVKSQSATKSHSNAHSGRRNKRMHGHNYYRYANSHSYLKYMGKAINGR
jgi:hypothetical protein